MNKEIISTPAQIHRHMREAKDKNLPIEIWKPPEIWVDEMGGRVEIKAHADFSIPPHAVLKLLVELPKGEVLEFLKEEVPEDLIYKVHYKVSMEIFPNE